MNTKLLEMEEFIKEKSREWIESGEDVVTTLMVQQPGNKATLVGLNISKDQYYDAVQAFLKQADAIGYIFVTEGWMAFNEAADKAAETGDVTDLPLDDRSEVLWVMAVEKGLPLKFSFAVIDNTPAGRKVREFNPPLGDDGLSERMVVLDW